MAAGGIADEIRTFRLLIVDQSPVSQELLPRIFERHGYVCAVAGTARGANEMLARFLPDAVLLDWKFRDGSGRGLAAQLRARATEAGRRLVVVILSVIDEPAGFRANEGIEHYFVKPTAIVAIDRVIRRELAAR